MRLRKTAATETLHAVGFFQLAKYNAKTGEFSGVLASETPDRAGEVLDYEKSKPYFKAWVEASKKASGGKSLGPVREMHQPTVAAGKLTSVTFDDQNKRVVVKGKIVDPVARQKAEEGVYTGLSVGGEYHGEPWQGADGKMHYIANPSEASLADIPCNPEAMLELVGADGLTKSIRFAPPPPEVIAADERAETPSFTAQVFGGRSLRKSISRTAMSDAAINPDELRKAMKKAARHAAKKQVKKAFEAFTAEDGPLMKALAGLASKEDVAAGLKKATDTSATVVAALLAEDDTPEALKKAADRVIALVPNDESKTGEDQSDEAKALRKTIDEAKAKLTKIAGDKGGAGERRLSFAASL